jgi:hypothetical protein
MEFKVTLVRHTDSEMHADKHLAIHLIITRSELEDSFSSYVSMICQPDCRNVKTYPAVFLSESSLVLRFAFHGPREKLRILSSDAVPGLIKTMLARLRANPTEDVSKASRSPEPDVDTYTP